MARDDSERILRGLYLEKDEQFDAFYRDNCEIIASNATDEEAMIITASHLSGSRDKNRLKLIFPSISDRKIDNLRERGLFSIEPELITSFYPLFGDNTVEKMWSICLTDVVKAIISLIEIKELHLSERRLTAYFSSQEYYAIFPSMEREETEILTQRIIKNLYDLKILEKDGRRLHFDSRKAFELISLDEIRMASYILYPELDEWIRKNSFNFIYLLKKFNGIRKDELDSYLTRAEVIAEFNYVKKEDLFIFLLLKEKDGTVSSPQDEKSEGPALISSDYSLSFLGSSPFLLSLMAEPVSIDRMKIFRIGKESVLNTFRQGYSAEEIIRFLKSVSDYGLAEPLSFRLSVWYEEYCRIQLERALILRADEKTVKVIKSIPEMKNYILEDLGNGILIMDSLAENEWRLILKNASFDMLPTTKGPHFDYESYESRSSFIEANAYMELNDARAIPYDKERKEKLLKSVKEKDPLLKRIKELMILSGIIFSSAQEDKKLEIEMSDAFNYSEKHHLLEKALKDKSLALVVENHSGKTAAGKVEMVESYEEGDHMVLGHKVLSISRLYKVALVPASFL